MDIRRAPLIVLSVLGDTRGTDGTASFFPWGSSAPAEAVAPPCLALPVKGTVCPRRLDVADSHHASHVVRALADR